MTSCTADSFTIIAAKDAAGLPRDPSPRFIFCVPAHWISPTLRNPFADEIQREVLRWLESFGFAPDGEEMGRVRKFDIAGYVGYSFPGLSFEKALRIAKYLVLWLLWDDVEVEKLGNRWRITASHVLKKRRPPHMTRYDEGWWQLMQEFAAARSRRWIRDLCRAMKTWDIAALKEAIAKDTYGKTGVPPIGFKKQVKLRIATIGMYATVYLLEDAYDCELPRQFHAHPTVKRLKDLANLIVGLGNDIFSLAKDCFEEQINLGTTLMHERGWPIDQALEHLIQMHDKALQEYDRLAGSISGWRPEVMRIIKQWLQDVRYASLGFSLWESQAPRYTRLQILCGDVIIQPRFPFFQQLAA